MTVEFPSDISGVKSNRTMEHYWFTVNVLCSGGARPETASDLGPRMDGMAFEVRIDGRKTLFNFADRTDIFPREDLSAYAARFKFHYDPGPTYRETWLPFSPISFLDWIEYQSLSRSIRYTASGRKIGNRQDPRGEALLRRTVVRNALLEVYGSDVVYERIDQRQFWMEAEDLLVSICVPGARNDILDRGQLQYMGLGVCTISPPLRIGLPLGRTLVPGTHYLPCAADYSDILRTVLWCRSHREECARIGANAKALFQEVLTGEKLLEWVLSCLYP